VALGAVVVAALVLVASAGLLWIDHHNDGNVSPSDGRLTPGQYAAAVNVARTEIAQTHGKVSAAVATMVKARPTDCNAEGMLVVQLVRDLNFNAGAPEPPTGPDQWVTIRANPADGQACSSGVGLGRFKAPAGAANLLPAL